MTTLYNVKLNRISFALDQCNDQRLQTKIIMDIIIKKHIKENPTKQKWFSKNIPVTLENFWEVYEEFGGKPDINYIFANNFPIHCSIMRDKVRFMHTIDSDMAQLARLKLCSSANDFVLLDVFDFKFVLLWESYVNVFTKRHYHMMNIEGL
ncbi:hypothetical protein GD1_132 [Paraglaciecola Antarctic GD virus 1]|nr:hypothetical protein GD1_132 [Paraglaciecola Antarctic GD virus 1]